MEDHSEGTDLIDLYMNIESDTFQQTIAKESPDGVTTLSKAQIEECVLHIKLWILSRIMREWGRTGEPPTTIEIEVKVK